MRLLADSSALIWSLDEPKQLSPRAREVLQDRGNLIWFSTASVWEIEIKRAVKKLDLSSDWRDRTLEFGFTELCITSVDATAGAHLPWHHRDPFDRMILAQALAHDLTVITRDTFLATYGVRVIAT